MQSVFDDAYLIIFDFIINVSSILVAETFVANNAIDCYVNSDCSVASYCTISADCVVSSYFIFAADCVVA